MLYIILFLSFIVFIYKILFWLYTFQLKEYRFDRFREYAFTKQWKKAFFNIFFILETPIFLISLIAVYQKIAWNHLITSISEQLYIPILLLLILEIFYILFKFKRKSIFKPIFTWRIKLLLIVSSLIFLILWTLVIFKINFLTSTFILFSILFPYLYIFLANILTLAIINFKKNKILDLASEKSKKITDMKKIAITWSYWKSAVKEFLSQILDSKYQVLKTPENINTEMWVADIILKKLDNKYDFFVAEMWAYKVWEIELLWNIVNHKDAFLTAIWTQHLWLFWSQNNIIQAKTEIIQKVMKNSWILYANYDNPEIQKIPFGEHINIVKYWIENKKADAISKIIKHDINSTIFDFSYKNYKHTFEVNILWEHNVLNLTWVIAFCLDNWMNLEEIKKAILNIKLPYDSYWIKDFEVTNKNGTFKLKIISSTRNLSVASLITWANILSEISGKKILIIEDILELWKQAKEIHKNVWKKIWKKDINYIHFVWANYSNSILEWLMEAYFEWNFSINWIFKEDIKEDCTIMFLWKRTTKYLKDFN